MYILGLPSITSVRDISSSADTRTQITRTRKTMTDKKAAPLMIVFKY